jgi:hypothetical protein
MKKRKIGLLVPVSLLCVIALSACASVPVGKYQVLKDSSQSLLTNTTDTYTRIEKLQRLVVVASVPDKPIDVDTFKSLTDKGISYDIVPALQYREQAFEVLVKYLNVLGALSSKDYMSDIDKASIELSGSLQTLIEKSNVINAANAPQVAGIFATLIDAISRPIIEEKRMDALKSIMDSSQGDLLTLTNLLISSNTKIQDFVVLARKLLIAHANLARPKYNSPLRYDYDKNIANQMQEIDEILASLDAINKGIGKIPNAHKEIRDSLDKKPSTMEALKGLVQEAQRVNKFYRSLNPTK